MAYPIGESYYYNDAVAAAAQYNVPTNLFLWQIGQESSWNPSAQNGNAIGLGQFMPGTAAQFGIDPSNPTQSLYAAAQYDAQLAAKNGGDWIAALTSYGTLAPSNWIGGTSSQGYQSALAGATSALGGATNSPAPGTGGSGGGNPLQQIATLLSNIFNQPVNIAWVVIGIVLLLGAFLLYGKDQGWLKNVPIVIPVE